MKYFITGASGFIGSALVTELIDAGHQVVGLARSDKSAEVIRSLGAEPLKGDLKDIAALKKGASESDGVAHCGFIHDFANFEAACQTDIAAIVAMAEAMQGTNKPLIASYGSLFLPNDHYATEKEVQPKEGFVGPRVVSEETLLRQVQKGVSPVAIRLPPAVHGEGDAAFIPGIIGAAQTHGKSAYVGDGASRWPSVHRCDAAYLYRLALEKPKAGCVLHAIAEQGIPFKDIATKIGQKLNVPVVSISPGDEANAHFGFLGGLVSVDNPVSSELTRSLTGWEPKQATLLGDLDKDFYFHPGTGTKFHG